MRLSSETTNDNFEIVADEKSGDFVSPPNRPRKVYAGIWGIPEIVALGFSVSALLIGILLWVFLVLPVQREYNGNRTKLDELERKLKEADSRYGSITTTEEQIAKLIASVNDFETRFLRNENDAKLALYQRINGLISAYGLVNTSGPDYAPLEATDQNRRQQSADEKGKSKFISIYPGVYVTMTVDGSYQNLRRFIRDIETSNEFIVITAIELAPSENKADENKNRTETSQNAQNNPTTMPNFPTPAQINQPEVKVDRGKIRGETVTLRLELASYYRRANFNPAPVVTNLDR
jgi:hypothetical protein